MVILGWSLCVLAPVFAVSSAGAAGAISQGFNTADTSLVAGTVVGLQLDSKSVVEKATSNHAAQLLGVVANKPLIALADGANQVQVVVSGLTPALVSDINGAVKVGDKITPSPIEGVGMKATTSTQIVGIAESDLSSSPLSAERITDKGGKATTVHVGTVQVQVNVSYYAVPETNLNQYVPGFLVNVSNSIAGKAVSPLRVLVGFCCLLAGLLTAAIMLQAGVRSGIISLGRNPLASGILRRSLIDVLVTAIGLLGVALVAFYLVLVS